MTTTVKSLPYVSEGIPAGFPSPAADYIGDRIDLNEVLILNPGATYYARVRDYYLVEEELEQGDGILFDTRLAPRTGDLAFCEVCGERMLKYIRKQGRELWLLGGGTDDTLSVDGDIEALARSIRRYERGRRGPADRIPRKGDDGMARQAEVQLRRPLRRRHHRAGRGNAEAWTLSARPHGLHAKREETDNGLPSGNESRHSSNT